MSVPEPSSVVTDTSTLPSTVYSGVSTCNSLDDTESIVASTPPNRTAAVSSNGPPEMLTVAPPAVVP